MHQALCGCCGQRMPLYRTPCGWFVRLDSDRLPWARHDCGHPAHGALAAAETFHAEPLLDFLNATAHERERMAREARQDLAAAGLNEAIIHEALERASPEELNGCPHLREDLVAARDRIIQSARLFLGMRAAAAMIGFAM